MAKIILTGLDHTDRTKGKEKYKGFAEEKNIIRKGFPGKNKFKKKFLRPPQIINGRPLSHLAVNQLPWYPILDICVKLIQFMPS